MADVSTLASLGTAVGTLVLGVATFASVRSANRSARVAEQSFLAGVRPLLVPTRLEDPPEKAMFVDDHWTKVPGGRASVELTDDAIYLVVPLRNVGNGIAVLHSWRLVPERLIGVTDTPDPADFRRQSRDLYIPHDDQGFWQAAVRDHDDELWDPVAGAIKDHRAMSVEILYGDHEGGQRTITLLSLIPGPDDLWTATVGRHWNLDRADPR